MRRYGLVTTVMITSTMRLGHCLRARYIDTDPPRPKSSLDLGRKQPAMFAPTAKTSALGTSPRAVNVNTSTPHTFAGTIFPKITRITSGRCSPELPSKRIRPLKTIGTGNPHLPPVIRLRPNNRNPPIPGPIGKHMLNRGQNTRPQLRVSRVMNLHRHCHTFLIRTRDFLHVTRSGAQTTARGHLDPACGNIVHPRRRLADAPDEIPFPAGMPRMRPRQPRRKSFDPSQ